MKDTDKNDKRLHRRLDIRLPLEYRRVDHCYPGVSHSETVNVSTGGLYFETATDSFKVGDELSLDVTVPNGDTRFPQHARVATVGRIVRVTRLEMARGEAEVEFPRYGIAANFQKPLKLAF